MRKNLQKISDEKVKEVREMYLSGQHTYTSIAKYLGLTYPYVSLICRNKRRFDANYMEPSKILSSRNKVEDNVISFIRNYTNICINDIEEILETLEDLNYLSKKGIKFRREIWKAFIRNNDKGNK